MMPMVRRDLLDTPGPDENFPASVATGIDTVAQVARFVKCSTISARPIRRSITVGGRAPDDGHGLAPEERVVHVGDRVTSGLFENEESAAASIAAGQHAQGVRDVIALFHHDVLEPVAQQRIDRSLVRTLDGQVIGDRALVSNRTAGVIQQRTRGVTERGAAGFNFFSRADAGLGRSHIAFARAHRGLQPLASARRRASSLASASGLPRQTLPCAPARS